MTWTIPVLTWKKKINRITNSWKDKIAMCNSVNTDYNIKTRKQKVIVWDLNYCWESLIFLISAGCKSLGAEMSCIFTTSVGSGSCCPWPRVLYIFTQCWQRRDSSPVAERVAHFQPVFVRREILSCSWESYTCSSGIGNRKRILSYEWESCTFSRSLSVASLCIP